MLFIHLIDRTIDRYRWQELCEDELALIVLQKVIRGCSIGIQIADGLSLNHGIMLELRTTNPLWDYSRMIMESKQERQRMADEHRQELIHHVRYMNTICSTSLFCLHQHVIVYTVGQNGSEYRAPAVCILFRHNTTSKHLAFFLDFYRLGRTFGIFRKSI